MKRIKDIIVLVMLLIFPGVSVFAQYLEVRRSANVKSDFTSSASPIEKAEPGDFYELLEAASSASNNYYKVRCKLSPETGYIYRTLVRRFDGPLPTNSSSINVAGPSEYAGIGQIPVGYYTSVEDMEGPLLRKGLHNIIKNHVVFDYDELWDLLKETDKDPNNPSNVILLYTERSQNWKHRDRGSSFPYEQNGYTYNDSWNREHVWAKSHGFPNEVDTPYTDLHHIKPADKTVNSARNNRAFDEGDIPYFDGGIVPTDCYKSEEYTWEPPDNVKGDIARMIFYMDIRYEGYTINDERRMDLIVVDSIPGTKCKDSVHGVLSTLLVWHEQDPVDNWERRRNHIIFTNFQKNRNPFIDHPEFVKKIWRNIN